LQDVAGVHPAVVHAAALLFHVEQVALPVQVLALVAQPQPDCVSKLLQVEPAASLVHAGMLVPDLAPHEPALTEHPEGQVAAVKLLQVEEP
jgi:hypothetical protein